MNKILKFNGVNYDQYNIENMISMFGKRIKNCIYYENGKPMGIISKEIYKLTKKWKFWNNDIAVAYKKYYGNILAPYLFINNPTVIVNDSNNNDILFNKRISMSKYKICDGK